VGASPSFEVTEQGADSSVSLLFLLGCHWLSGSTLNRKALEISRAFLLSSELTMTFLRRISLHWISL
jgi:hypothetical protein